MAGDSTTTAAPRRIEAVRTGPKDAAAAWDLAKREREPVWLPAVLHADDRGWSLMNQLQGVLDPGGQVNYSVQYPGVIKGWHRHRLQTDFWICLSGHIKAGIHRSDDDRTWMAILGEKRPGVLIIPHGLWHGAATVGHEPAGLMYYVSTAYNPADPDEDRRAYDSVPGFVWGVTHR